MVTLGFGGIEVFGATLLDVEAALDSEALALPLAALSPPSPPQEASPKTSGRLSNIATFLSFIFLLSLFLLHDVAKERNHLNKTLRIFL